MPKGKLRKAMFAWAELWSRLAREGVCDEIGGAEYLRVREKWNNRTEHISAEAFIRREANRPAPEVKK